MTFGRDSRLYIFSSESACIVPFKHNYIKVLPIEYSTIGSVKDSSYFFIHITNSNGFIKRLTTVFFLMLLYACANSQVNRQLTFKLVDTAGYSIDNATIALYSSLDTTNPQRVVVTDNYGMAKLQADLSSTYILASRIGFYNEKRFIETSVFADTAVLTIVLKWDMKVLEGVKVRSASRVFDIKSDKTIVNVSLSPIFSGISGFEALVKAPGIISTGESAVTLNGSPNLLILFDGKEIFQDKNAAVKYLKDLPSSSIARIEIVSNPSAAYDAKYSGGVINVVSSRPPNFGSLFRLNHLADFGKYQRTSHSINFSSFGKVYNIGITYATSINEFFNRLQRTQLVNSGRTPVLNLSSNTLSKYFSNSFRLSIDRKGKNGKSESSFNVTSRITPTSVLNRTNSIRYLARPDSAIYLNQYQKNDFSAKSVFVNIGQRVLLDSLLSSIAINISGGVSVSDPQNYIMSASELKPQQIVDEYSILNSRKNRGQILSGLVDYVYNLSKTKKIETGYKFALSTTETSSFYDTVKTNSSVRDNIRSLTANYREYYHAAYFSYSKRSAKKEYSIGIRMERTSFEVKSKSPGFRLAKVFFLPNLKYTFFLPGNNSLTVAFRRLTFRTGYDVYDPAIIFFDNYTYYQGNPGLQFNTTNSLSSSYVLKGKYSFRLAMENTRNGIAQVYQPDAYDSALTRITYVNVRSVMGYSASAYIPVTISKFWSMSISVNSFYLDYIKYDRKVFPSVDKGNLTLRASLSNSISLPTGYSVEVNAYYKPLSRFNQVVSEPFISYDASFRKSIFKKKLDINISIQDITNSIVSDSYAYFSSYYTKNISKDDTRRYRINLSYRFGNNKVNIRRKQTGIEEEQSRLSSGQSNSINQ